MTVEELLIDFPLEIAQRYEAGEALDKIGLFCGCTRNTIKKAVIALHGDGRIKKIRGVLNHDFCEPKKENIQRGRRPPETWKSAVLAMRKDGWTYLEIALETDLKLNAVIDMCDSKEKAPASCVTGARV